MSINRDNISDFGGGSDGSTGSGDSGDSSETESDDDGSSSGGGLSGSIPGAPDDSGESNTDDSDSSGVLTGRDLLDRFDDDDSTSSSSDGSSGSTTPDFDRTDDDRSSSGGGLPGFIPGAPDDSSGSNTGDSAVSDDDGSSSGGGLPGFIPGAPDDSSGSNTNGTGTADGTTGPSGNPRGPGAIDDSGFNRRRPDNRQTNTPDDGLTDGVSDQAPGGRRGVASDEDILAALEADAARNSSFSQEQLQVTGFEERNGELQPIIVADGAVQGTSEVPQEFRDDILSNATGGNENFSVDEANLTTDDGELTVTFDESAVDRAQRSAAAEQLDEQFPSVDIGASDVTIDGDVVRLTDAASESLSTSLRGTAGGLVSDPVGADGRQGATGATNLDGLINDPVGVTESNVNEQLDGGPQPNNEPGRVATAVGNVFSAIDSSPAGDAIDTASETVFGDLDDRSDGLTGQIDSFLAEVERGFENQITDPISAADPDAIDAQRFNAPRPFGISGEDAQQTTVEFAEFINPGSIGRDFVTLAESGASAREFLLNNGPEGVQVAGEVAAGGAQTAPGVARDVASDVRENPRDAARTGTALAATFGAGALASGVARGGAAVASSGVRTGVSTADDAAGVVRRSGGDLRQRAPDVDVRQDPNAGILEVDPLLQQQIRNAVSRRDTDISLTSGADESLARRIGRATERAQVNARLNTDIATSAVREAIPSRNTLSGLRSGGDASAARRAGRATELAQVNARLNADAAASAVRESIPDSTSLPGIGLSDDASEPLARRAGRATERAQIRARLRAGATQARLENAIPSRPSGFAFSGSETSLARRAGRRFESERLSLQLNAAAAPTVARTRARDAAESVVDRIESAAGAPRSAVPELSRPDFDFSAPSLSFTRPDRQVRDVLSGLRDTTIRIGPARPARTDVEIGDFDLDLDRFDDEFDLELDDAGSAGGRTDFEADVAVEGGDGGGSGQLSTLRMSQRSDADIELDTSTSSRRRQSSFNPDTDILSGVGAIGAGSFSLDSSARSTPVSESLAPVLDTTAGTTATETEIPGLDTTTDIVGDFDFSAPLEGLSTTPTTGSITDVTTSTTQTTAQTTQAASPSSGRFTPPRAPDFEIDGPDRSDGEDVFSTEIDDDLFDTGVADAGDVLDDLF
jgi:hypothetical protein